MPQVYYRYEDGTIVATNGTWHPHGAEKIKPQTEGARQYKEQAREQLRGILAPNRTVYTVLNHAARSGMSRRISLFIGAGEAIRDITGYVAQALGEQTHDKGGITVNGCGMDMGFHLVYRLGSVLWPNGTDKPHGTRNGQPDSDGGYALKQKWI